MLKLALTLATLTMGSVGAEEEVLTAEQTSCCCCETTEGLYIGAFAGATWWHDTLGHENDLPGVFGQFNIPWGWNVAGFIGHRWCNGLRVEFELAYRQSDIEGVIIYQPPQENHDETASEWETTSLMFNVLYECSYILCDCCIRPFFGFGIGPSHVSMHTTDTSATFRIDGDEWAFAYQLMAGVAYPVNSCIDIAAEYRFFCVDEVELKTAGVTYYGRRPTPSHNFIVSAKYVFASLW